MLYGYGKRTRKARAIFLVNVPIAVAVVIGALLYLPSDQERGSRRIDLAGIVTLSSSLLLVLLGLGGLGLGTGFNTLIGHLTNAGPSRYAPDISGASTTTLQIGGAIGVAAFGPSRGRGRDHRCFRHHHPRFGRNHHDRRGECPSCHPHRHRGGQRRQSRSSMGRFSLTSPGW